MLNRQHFIGSNFHENSYDDADNAMYQHRLEEGIRLKGGVDTLWIIIHCRKMFS